MRYFEEHAVKDFAKRLKYNRKQRFGLTQSDIGDSSQISQIESGKRNITSTILYDFHLATGLDYTEIIFGDINRFVGQLFYTFFSTILLRNFQIIENGYYTFPILAYSQMEKLQISNTSKIKKEQYCSFQIEDKVLRSYTSGDFSCFEGA